ncbi:MAG: AmmeMemoRadiSam system radical SAM enzyme [Promethearchaeota archaeon Loki_b32]|nr:MAG: AmmeMemoRadiSam system radical SAM enzyme [Candidatus Lokiarchaeota archaeon Loki_b32]
MNSDFTIRAKHQRKIDENFSQCLICERKCKISNRKSGFCQSRTNKEGEIYSVVYGLIPALSFNPIEKKPLYHFHPGSTAITAGTYGCNFACFWCQNHHLSKTNAFRASQFATSDEFLSPKKLIEIALNRKCDGTSISFNEPTLLFEYSLEVFKLAKENGLYNTYVTNGYMTEEVLKDLVDAGLDAMNIDIKGDSDMVEKYCGIDVEKVWRNAKLAKILGVHVEITTLLIQGFNSEDEIIRKRSKRIFNELGEFTPYHISRFFPHYKSQNYGLSDPTPLELLYNAYDIAKDVGLKYVYLGNLPTTDYDNTYCPKCSKLVIKRKILGIKESYLDSDGNCKFCGFPICII